MTTDDTNDETSAAKNRTGRSMRLRQNNKHQGDYTGFDAGTDDGYLANNQIGDNRASSASFLNCRAPGHQDRPRDDRDVTVNAHHPAQRC